MFMSLDAVIEAIYVTILRPISVDLDQWYKGMTSENLQG